MKQARVLAIGVVVLSLTAFVASAQDTSQTKERIRVSLPNGHNLQWISFWVALGAGYFTDEKLDVALVMPPDGGGGGGGGQGMGTASGNGTDVIEGEGGSALEALMGGSAEIAVMPRPTYLIGVSQERPIVSFANLLSNDPINLVVQRDIVDELGLSMELPLRERLERMSGLKVGVAPGPPPRLRALWESVGLDAETDIEIVLVPGAAQNVLFGQGTVDAIYAHTPFLETALVDQDGVMIVNQSGGEVPALAGREIHLLVTTHEFAASSPETLEAIARAIHRATRLIRSDHVATADAIQSSGIELQAPHALDILISIYAGAVPETPEVSVEGALREVELTSERREQPDLSGIDLELYIDNQYATRATQGD